MIKAGAGKAKICFQPDDYPLKAFTGEHDSLNVRAVLLEAEERMLIVSIELTSLPAASILHFKKTAETVTGISQDHILISVTHHFSGPHIPPEIKNADQHRLSDILYERIDEAVKNASVRAADTLGPVSVHFGKASCCLNVNRNVETPKGWWTGRSEDGWSDKFIRLVSLDRADSTHLCVLYNYDVQSSVMDQIDTRDGARLLSADFIGMASAKLEEYYGCGFTAVFLPGAAGDQAPILKARYTDLSGHENDIHEDGYIVSGLMAEYMAERIKGCLDNPADKDFPADGYAIGTAYEEGCGDADKCGINLRRIKINLPGQVMKYSTKELTPHKTYSFENTGKQVGVEIIRFNIGDISVLATQPELNSGFGRKIRGIIGEKSLIATLVDGAVKYLPEETDFERITYTAMNTGIGRGADKIFLQALDQEAEK